MNRNPGTKPSRQAAVQLDWQVCESETGWQAARQGTTPVIAPQVSTASRRWSRRLLWGVIALVAAGTAGLLAYRGQVGLAAVEQELAATRVNATGPHAGAVGGKVVQIGFSPFAAHVLGEVTTELKLVDLGADWSVAQVVVQTGEAAGPQRQVRVYTKQGDAWVQTAPTVAQWGRAQQLETDHFVFSYFARDAVAVERAAPRLDKLYGDFYAAFFAGPPPRERWVVQVDPTVPAGILPQIADTGTPLTVASSAATLAPVAVPEADLLVQSVALEMVQRLGDRATTHYALSRQWRPLFSGLGLWLMWEHDLPLSVWHKPLVAWVMWDPQSAGLPEDPQIPAFAHELCAHYRLWMEVPVEVGVPVSCWWKPDAQEGFLTWRFPYRPLDPIPLPQLPAEAALSLRLKRLSLIQAEEVAYATVLEYAAATYGVAQLPRLLDELPEHETWATLLPAVFGVTQTDFETGWRDFLKTQYGVNCCTRRATP